MGILLSTPNDIFAPSKPSHSRPEHPRRQSHHSNHSHHSSHNSPPEPIVYILSYASEEVAHSPAALLLLRSALHEVPSHIPTFATIQCIDWIPPPEEVCRKYSGTSAVVQEWVMRDWRARSAVGRAVGGVLGALEDMEGMRKRDRSRGRKDGDGRDEDREGNGRNGGRYPDKYAHGMLIVTTCAAGTHRSVAAADIIARRLAERGVRVRVRHVHRRRREGDAW